MRRLALLAGLLVACGEPVERGPLNVVFVLADDLGWADVGYNGSTFHRTPHIDALAESGLVFTDAYSASPVCSPSRASIVSGLHPVRLGMTKALSGVDKGGTPGPATRGPADEEWWEPRVRNTLPPEDGTFARRLQEAGYRVGFVGKWHLGGRPTGYGFGTDVGASAAGVARSYFSPYGLANLPDGPGGEYLTDRLTDEALAFLRVESAAPFFLFLSHYAVHSPFEAKPEVVAAFEGRSDPEAGQRNPVYAAMIASLDDSVGRLVAALEELDLARSTVVVFTSDNGGWEERSGIRRGLEPYRITSNAPLRSGKGRLYEGGIRVPTIVSGPVVANPGTSCDVPILGTDFYPTFLGWAGLAPAKPLDGLDLAPLLAGDGRLERERLLFHFPHQQMTSAIRRGPEKLIYFHRREAVELYDLATDPGESVDLAAVAPERARALGDELFAWLREAGAHLPVRNPAFEEPK